MRLTVMGQMTKGLATERNPPSGPADEDEYRLDPVLEEHLEGLKRHLWQGNVYRALQIVEDLEWYLESQGERSERAKKFLKAVGEFHHYIAVNQASIPNYGDRYCHGEAISTAFAESAVNQVGKRMVKKQQVHWTERGAQLLLHVGTRVLNEDLRTTEDRRTTFERWYPGMKADIGQADEVAAWPPGLFHSPLLVPLTLLRPSRHGPLRKIHYSLIS
jgi:hypothetical protein